MEKTLEHAMSQTFGDIPGVSSDEDYCGAVAEDTRFSLTYVFADRSDGEPTAADHNPRNATFFTGYFEPDPSPADLESDWYNPEQDEVNGLINDVYINVRAPDRGQGLGRQIVEDGLEELVRVVDAPWRGHAVQSAKGFWDNIGYTVEKHGTAYGIEKPGVAVRGREHMTEDERSSEQFLAEQGLSPETCRDILGE